MGRNHSAAKSRILKEQFKLCCVKSQLEKMLITINEQLNVLKVEELQLRSNSIHKLITKPTTRAANSIDISLNSTTNARLSSLDFPEEVNKQDINLETIINQFDQEDEDSD